MQVTIDTQKDSPAEIRKVIAFLEQLLGKEEKPFVATPMMPLVVEEAEEEKNEILPIKEQETPQKPSSGNIFQTFKDSTRNVAPGPKGFFDIVAGDVHEKKVNKEQKENEHKDQGISIYEIDE